MCLCVIEGEVKVKKDLLWMKRRRKLEFDGGEPPAK